MRSTWLTFAVAALLGLFAQLGIVAADDLPSDSDSTAPRVDTASQKRAQEVLRRSMTELEANRFEAARLLAKQAKEIGATYSLFDIRPEQVLAEIDRRERNAAGVVRAAVVEPTAASSVPNKRASLPPYEWAQKNQSAVVKASGDSGSIKPGAIPAPPIAPTTAAAKESQSVSAGADEKARAIELLDKGLLALDEKRFDDAERLARDAAQLHVAWDKYDYRPDNLLDESRMQRTATPDKEPVASSKSPLETPKAGNTPPTWDEIADPILANKTSQPSTAAGELSTPPAEPREIQEVAVRAAAQEALPKNEGAAAAGPQRSEKLLKQALGDLQAGRGESARHKIEGALMLIHGPEPSPVAADAVSSTTVGAGASASKSQVFLTSRPASLQSVASDNAGESVEMLKPLHDHFMADEPLRTQMSSPNSLRFRENSSQIETMHALYQPKRPASSMSENAVTQTAYEPTLTRTATTDPLAPKVQTTQNTTATSPPPGWLEKLSEPVGPPSLLAPPTRKSAAAPLRTSSNAPQTAPPRTMNNQRLAAGRQPYPPPRTVSPEAAPTQEQQRPGYFRKIWNALRGE